MIAVTGPTGFVGTALVDMIQQERLPIRLLPRNVLPSLSPGVSQFPIGDLGSARIDPAGLAGCRVLVHTAARAHQMGDDPRDMEPYEKTNVRGSIDLANAAISAGVQKFIFISSIKACGEWSSPGIPLLPSDLCQPLDAYGKSKLTAERELASLASNAGMDLVIIRPPLIHGPGAKGNLNRLMHAIAEGKPLPLGGISTNRRSVLGVTNLCDAILSVAGVRSDADLDSATVEKNASPHQKSLVNTYHLDDGGVVSTRRLVELLAEGIGKRARLFNVPYWLAITAGTLLRKRDYVRRLYGDMETSSEAFRKDFQWQPKVGLEDGLRMMASHFIRSIRQAK